MSHPKNTAIISVLLKVPDVKTVDLNPHSADQKHKSLVLLTATDHHNNLVTRRMFKIPEDTW